MAGFAKSTPAADKPNSPRRKMSVPAQRWHARRRSDLIGQGENELSLLTNAVYCQRHARTGRSGAQSQPKIRQPRLRYRLAIDRFDHIADTQTCALGRTGGCYVHNL